MRELIYNIPSSRLPQFRGRPVIVRLTDARAVADVPEADGASIVYVQFMADVFETHRLDRWPSGVPADVVLSNVENPFSQLYEYSRLLSDVPTRVTIPARRGFEKAAKLAASLGMAVRLEPGQPGPDLMEAFHQALDSYLHQAGASQPVEFFHSVLSALYHRKPASLWTIQEEDSGRYRYIDDSGAETISRRVPAGVVAGELGTFVHRLQTHLLAKGAECARCEFFPVCGGYFKWPEAAYRCDGIRSLFQILWDAAEDLRKDVAVFGAIREGGA